MSEQFISTPGSLDVEVPKTASELKVFWEKRGDKARVKLPPDVVERIEREVFDAVEAGVASYGSYKNDKEGLNRLVNQHLWNELNQPQNTSNLNE